MEHRQPSPEYAPAADIQAVAGEARNALLGLDLIRPLQPGEYWAGKLEVVETDELNHPQGLPLEIHSNRTRKSMAIIFDHQAFEYYVDSYSDGSPVQHDDLLKLCLAYGMIHDLSIRALPPEKTNEFIDHITHPNGLFTELLESRIIDEEEPYATMQEFMVGDEDRIAKVNVARFAIGVACEAFTGNDSGFRDRIVGIFRPELARFLQNGPSYKRVAEAIFDQQPEKAQMMLVEHIKDFDLAAAFPKHRHDIEAFVDIYS